MLQAQGVTYRPVYHHWFYRKEIEGKTLWHPFSMPDSLALEGEFTSCKQFSFKFNPQEFVLFNTNLLKLFCVLVIKRGLLKKNVSYMNFSCKNKLNMLGDIQWRYEGFLK